MRRDVVKRKGGYLVQEGVTGGVKRCGRTLDLSINSIASEDA